MKNIFILCFSLLLSFELYSQHVFEINGDIFGRRVFIKNNGQFDDALPNHQTIDYAYINGTEQVYFNKTGVTYLLQKPEPLTHQQREEREHEKSITVKPTIKKNIHVTWENANPDVEIIEAEKQLYYHSFGELKFKSNCYKKIIYKNVYNHIDIEYVFTTEKDKGIKYNVILHPGANITDVKINYSGDVQKISLKKGNVVIQTGIIDVTELAPVSYQNGLQIVSNFSINDHTITFQLPNGYDTDKELMIDPWVINLSFDPSNGTEGYDVDYDAAGNYFVYGGSPYGPYCISKYNSSGVLIWTFGGQVSSIGWPNDIGTVVEPYLGNFVVDKGSGKSYLGDGSNFDGARIIRLDANGIYDNFVTTRDKLFTEIWDMGYNCATGYVYGLGGSVHDVTSAGIVNTTTGAFVAQNLTGFIGDYSQDVVSHTIDPSGNIFLVIAKATPLNTDNLLLKVNAAFTGNIWMAPTTYTTLMESNNKKYPTTAILAPTYSNGFNCLASNNSYLYYYDGLNLAAYNKTTGAKIGFTTLIGQTELEQGGISVDDCNNLYLGGNGFIKCYAFDGTKFTVKGNIPVASPTAYKYLTDIKYNAGSNNLYVSGTGFGGVYSAINSITCTISNSLTINTCDNISVEHACYSNTDYSVPNAFTPNSDGVNDEFCLEGWAHCTTTFYVGIYDQWGEKVFESTDPDFCWDGIYKGQVLNTAVFIYFMQAEIIKVGNITKKGNITLVR